MESIKTDSIEKNALKRAFLRYLAIPIVLIVLSSLFISHSYYHTKKHDLMHQQQDEIVTAMIAYRDHVSYMTSIMRTAEAEFLSQTASGASQTEIEALFMQYMTDYPDIDKLRILDLNGMEILRLNKGSDAPYVVPKADLQDKSDRYFYQEAKVLSKHQFLFSALDLNMDNEVIDIDPQTGLAKPTLRICSPVDINEQRYGYLVVNFLMRDTLNKIRNFLDMPGCYIIMFNEDGYLYNDADDANNFRFCYDETDAQQGGKISDICQCIDLSKTTDSCSDENKLCSYTMFANIYDRSQDYILSNASAKYLCFLVYYDHQSPYALDLEFSYFYHLCASWPLQLAVWIGILLIYILMLHLFLYFDRNRFTDLFSEHQYTKSVLRTALRHHEFVNYYQPIINIQDGSILGIEALSRWKTDDQVLPPSAFIDELLHYQLGQKLDENVFSIVRKDCKQLKAFPCFKDAFISINCCQQTFDSLIKDPPATTIQLTEEEKSYIVLELLENIVFNQKTQDRIRDLYKHNIIFAIDDFGTGNSNVAFIRSFENLKVKIDRTFVPVDTTNKKEGVIIEAFVKMFIDQGLKMIVEGVETKEQIRYLRNLGVQGVQGFYFSQPMDIGQLIEFMENKEYLKKL